MANSLAGSEEVERHLRRVTTAVGAAGHGAAGAVGPEASAYASYLREARDMFRHRVSSNVRFSSLLKVRV